MTPAMLITSIVAIAVTLALIGVDIYWAADGIKGNTISEVIRFSAERFKLIPFAWGILGGHFFHPNTWHLPSSQGVATMIWCAMSVEMLSLGTTMPMFCYLVLGVIAGMICWPV
jgi:hypothetical protein